MCCCHIYSAPGSTFLFPSVSINTWWWCHKSSQCSDAFENWPSYWILLLKFSVWLNKMQSHTSIKRWDTYFRKENKQKRVSLLVATWNWSNKETAPWLHMPQKTLCSEYNSYLSESKHWRNKKNVCIYTCFSSSMTCKVMGFVLEVVSVSTDFVGFRFWVG